MIIFPDLWPKIKKNVLTYPKPRLAHLFSQKMMVSTFYPTNKQTEKQKNTHFAKSPDFGKGGGKINAKKPKGIFF